jgi:hypothetical protein
MKDQYPITGIYFVNKYVVYSSMVNGDRFASIHNRTGLSDEQAKGYFVKEHQKEVRYLIRQKETTAMQ